MTGPLLSLLIVLGLLALATALLWPDRGILWRVMRALSATERVLVEDALKHLFDCEYRGLDATLHSVSGSLGVTGRRASEVLGGLEARELVRPRAGRFELTPQGRRYALRVVRIHRLWEAYLSQRTGHEPAAWHLQAEIREHTTSADEAAALSASLGHPRWDPHGDPIPTEGGELPPPTGRPLDGLAAGEAAEIVHLEDEPEAVYAQLVAEGLYPGQRLRLIESTPRALRFEADGEEHVLAPVLAANVSVLRLPVVGHGEAAWDRLSLLELGASARVVSISPALSPSERRRMLDLGLVPGTVVEAELRGAAGDPTAYRVRGAVIALRREQAENVRIERLATTAAVLEAGSAPLPEVPAP